MLRLQLLGGCSLSADGEAISGPASQRRRLALLVLVASSGARGFSRDKLVAYFWPEEDRERARHFLADSLFRLRKALGKDILLTTGDDVRINPSVVDVDVVRFANLVLAGDHDGAVAIYQGPFLDGFFVSDAPDFERWVDVERDRLAHHYATCLEQLATRREAAGDWSGATAWWRRLAAHDPHSARVAVSTMRALEASGDIAGALQHARTHETRLRVDLDLEPDAAVAELAQRLRLRPPVSSAPNSPAPSAPGAMAPFSARMRGDEPIGVKAAPPVRPMASRPATRPVLAALTLVVLAAAGVVAFRTGRTPERASADTTVDRGIRAASAGLLDSPHALATHSRRDEARELYTQGRYTLTKGQFDPVIHRGALELFRRAVERDSSFAPAYAGMADVYNHADDPVHAKENALRAIALDSSLAEAYTALAYTLGSYEHDWTAADSVLRRAIALDPRYVLAHLRRANQLAATGRFDEAAAEVERAREIQPESFVVLLNRALIADIAGRSDEAVAHYQEALALEPGRIDAQEMLMRAYWGQGRYAEAQGVMRSIGNIAGIAAMSGNADTMAMLAPRFAASTVPDSIRHAGALYTRLGRRAEAFEQLERLYKSRDKHLALTLRQQPFVSLRDDPRYARLMAKMNLR